MRLTVLSVTVLAVLLLGSTQAEIPDAPASFITVDELRALLDRGRKVDIVDVRRREAYLQQHIKGARSIPLDTFPDRPVDIKKSGLVVLY
jgi:rhodanese-related sulfurtransferase